MESGFLSTWEAKALGSPLLFSLLAGIGRIVEIAGIHGNPGQVARDRQRLGAVILAITRSPDQRITR